MLSALAKVASLSLSGRGWLLLGAGLFLASTVLVALGYSRGYADGGIQATEKASKELEQRLKEQYQLLNEANKRIAEQEKTHAQTVAILQTTFKAQQAAAKAEDASTIAALESGNKRLRFQISSCTAPQSNSAGSSAKRSDGAGSGELAPETASALWSIARDGDRAIRKLTALQAWAASMLKAQGQGVMKGGP